MNGVDAMLQPPRAAGFASDAGTKDGAATDAAAAPDASHPDEEADASGQEGSVVELQVSSPAPSGVAPNSSSRHLSSPPP